MITRRSFLGAIAASLTVPRLNAADLSFVESPQAGEWGSPVLDLHFHMRGQPAQNLAHLDGAGIAKANLLTRANAAEQVAALQAVAPGRFTWFASADFAQPAGVEALTQAVKSGARGLGEI